MSQSTSKLVQYLQDHNYEMAVTAYNNSPEPLSYLQSLELSRAFFVNQNYKKCLDIVKPILSSAKKMNATTAQQRYTRQKLIYEAGMLKCKSQYLLGENKKSQQTLNQVQSGITDSKCCRRIVQIKENLEKQRLGEKGLMMNKNQINTFGKKVLKRIEEEQQEHPLRLGLPMFAVSAIWFDKFLSYCRLKDEPGEYPGIITHFEILDDKYDSFYDPTSQKQHTNYHFYPTAQTRILSKSCWAILKEYFHGYDIKRFNISVLGRPNQIFTQIFLKSIFIKKENDLHSQNLQISKKQSFGGVVKKIKAAWKKQGYLYCISNKDRTFVDEKIVLEETDTSERVYEFSSMPPTDKEKANTNGKPTRDAILSRCQNCKKTQNLKFCKCKSVKYCDIDCLKQDRERHLKKCDLQISHLKQKSAILQNFSLTEKTYSGKKGLVGLRNLGNTCYMNSGLQCLSNTKQLTEYFMSNHFLKQVNNTNPLGTKGNLACAYAELIRQIWTGSDSSVSPFSLKKIIGKFAGQFSGYGQQDSQQFISYLIDGLQEDLNLVKHKQNFEAKDEILPDEQASRISQQNYAKRIQSYIRSIMVGQFKSTVICSKCDRKSICFDPFMLVTLPIPKIIKQKQIFFIRADPQQKTLRCYIQYQPDSTIGDLKRVLERKYRVSAQQYNNWIQVFIVNLDSLEVIKQNISETSIFAEEINKLNDNDSFLIYQFFKPREGEKLHRVEAYYKNQKICFPRFVNINEHSSTLDQTFFKNIQRFIQRRSTINSPSQIFKKQIVAKNGQIQLHLTVGLSMLRCETAREKYSIARQKASLNLQYCLQNFQVTETLEKNNQWYCNKCKKFVKATKQMEIYKSNKILVLAFKRFSRGYKVKSQVDFPVQNLDMGPYIKSNITGKPLLYDLYGIVNHYGTLYGGHYTAYCKNFLNERWYQFDDSHVSEVRVKNIISENAYVLFYRLKD